MVLAHLLPHMRALPPAALALQVHALVGDGAGLKAISPTFYLIFWSLSLYDLQVPNQR